MNPTCTPNDGCVEIQKEKGTGGGGSRQSENERLQMTPQERKAVRMVHERSIRMQTQLEIQTKKERGSP